MCDKAGSYIIQIQLLVIRYSYPFVSLDKTFYEMTEIIGTYFFIALSIGRRKNRFGKHSTGNHDVIACTLSWKRS